MFTRRLQSLKGGRRSGRRVTLPGLRPFYFLTHEDRTDLFISYGIRNHGTWEPLETELICRLLPLFTVFIDVGANIGWYTAIAQRAATRRSRIFSFEPEPNNFSMLQRNCSRLWPWPKTTMVQQAVSDRDGVIALHLSPSNQGDHRIYPSEEIRPSVTVPVTTLDAFFNAPLPPFLLKSDTQGSEPRILRGGRRVLSPNLASSVLILEFWPHGMVASGEKVEAFIDDLAKLPHQPFLIDNEQSKLRPITWEMLAARCKQDLAPTTEAFVDLALLDLESEAYRAVLDLIVRPFPCDA